jgi:hypothetical protein
MLSDPLIHIGFHKTGTTWLQRELFHSDSDCFCPLTPDRNRNSGKFIGKHFVRDHERYLLSSFVMNTDAIQQAVDAVLKCMDPGGRVPVISYERLSGNPHAGSFDARTIADRIKASFPEARIFCVIREQRDIILSTYFQYLKIGGTDTLTDYLTRSYDGRRPGFSPAAFNYIDLVDYYYELFSPENVLVLPYEILRDSASEFLCRIGDFTGKDLAGFTDKAAVSHNRRRDAFLLPRFPFLNMLCCKSSVNGYSPLYLPGSKFVFDSIDSLIGGANRKRIHKMKRQLDEIIGNRYAAGNRRLSKLIDIELSDYGY